MSDPILNDPILPRSTPPNIYGPISASQMFERTASLLRDNFKLFFSIVLVVIGVEVVIGGVLGGTGFMAGHSPAGIAPLMNVLFVLPLALLGGLLIFVFVQLTHGAIFKAAQARLAGAGITAGEACQRAAERIGRLVGISILVALRIFGYLLLFYMAAGIVIAVFAVALGGFTKLAAGAAAFRQGSLPAMGAGLVFAIVLLILFAAYLFFFLWLITRYAVAVPAALAENLPVTDAIRRSIHLTRGSKGRLYALYLVVGAVWIAFMALALPVQLMALHNGSLHPGFHSGAAAFPNLVIEGFKILLSAVILAFAGVATALCYFDLRARKEAFGVPAAPPVLEIPPAPLAPVMPAEPIEGFPLP